MIFGTNSARENAPHLFEPVIIPLVGVDPAPQSGLPVRSPIAGLLHRAGDRAGKLLLYVPGGVPGAPLDGRYDYQALATRLASAGVSLLVMQMTTSQHPTPDPLRDCESDIASVLAWCEAEGWGEIVLAGNGLGATRIVRWAAANVSPVVASLFLLSPVPSPFLAIEAQGSGELNVARERVLAAARALIAAGRGHEIVEADLDGGRRAYTAAGLFDCFGPPEEAGTTLARYVGGITFPTCIIHGDKDSAAQVSDTTAVFDGLTRAGRKEIVTIACGGHHLLADPATVAVTAQAITDRLVAG